MKNDGVNRDRTIEVGDLVRVVAHLPHDPGGFEGNDFIVEQSEDNQVLLVGANGTEWWFYPEELEIMQEKGALKSVYAEEKKLEEKKDLAYELCKKIHEGYIHWDDKMAALKEIFED